MEESNLWYVVWWNSFLLLLTCSAWLCLGNSPSHVGQIIIFPVLNWNDEMLFDLVTYKSYQGPRLDSNQQGSSSQSEAASNANQLQKIYTSAFRKKNANLLLSEIHEQIRSTDPEYTKKTFFSHKRRDFFSKKTRLLMWPCLLPPNATPEREPSHFSPWLKK